MRSGTSTTTWCFDDHPRHRLLDVIALALVHGDGVLWQHHAVRLAGAAHHGPQGRAVPDRGAGELHQLSDRPRHRRGGADLARDPLSDLFRQRRRRDGRRQYLLPHRAHLLARQHDGARLQPAVRADRDQRDRPPLDLGINRVFALVLLVRRRRLSWSGAGCIRAASAGASGWCVFPRARWCWCRSWSGCSISRLRRSRCMC